MSTEAEAQQMADRVKVVGGGRERGPDGIAMSRTPQQFRLGLGYSELTRMIATIEVLFTAAQLDDWLARNVRRRT
jgi:hypothetical protein